MSFAPITQSDSTVDKRGVRAEIDAALSDGAVTRLIVQPDPPTSRESNPDRHLALVLAALMALDRLDVEVAYAPAAATAATRAYRLPHGAESLRLAENGTAAGVPLIRDDAGTVLVGRARHLGAEGAKLHGECYVDDARLFRGDTVGVVIEPTPEPPGLRARLERRLPGGRWHTGRAAQTGGTNLVVEREGVVGERIVKRSTFYRHHIDLLLVRP